MTQDFESFNDQDDEWLSELETRAIDLENELYDWRESRARELAEARARERAESVYRREAGPGPGGLQADRAGRGSRSAAAHPHGPQVRDRAPQAGRRGPPAHARGSHQGPHRPR